MSEAVVLARRAQAAQLRTASNVEAGLRFVWQSVDLEHLDRDFDSLAVASKQIVGAGRAQSLELADAYYAEARELAGLPSTGAPALIAPEGYGDALVTDLYVNGPASVKRAVERGDDLALAGQVAANRLAGVGKRYALNAARHATIARTRTDPQAVAWARVSDGVPCSFCAMLVGRGPVYGAKTVRFQAHNKCGCTVRPVFRNDEDGGWSPDAEALAKLWASVGEGKTWTRAEWRAHYNATLHDPEAPLTRALAETYREAGASGVAAAV